MLSLSFCILLLASLFHTMTKVKYKFNISLSNNAYSWCNIQDTNFMRRFRNFRTLILPLMIYFWEDVTNILFAESKRWNLRWKRKFYRRNWLWPFTSDAMLFCFPRLWAQTLTEKNWEWFFSEGGKWSEVGSGVVQDYFTASVKPVFKIISYQRWGNFYWMHQLKNQKE